ncbi:MAG: phosphomannomutase, partial [Solirubrobacteraceae bacterium]|nr:phosphomannomutase [Solirubrobacteraceae bacterium]
MSIPSEIFKAYDIRGLYGDQIDGDAAERIGRAFARVIGDLAGKPVADCRIGLGRDMRLTAAEMAARYREGMVSEGATVIDAGQVGTEMLYWLVGSRELDGGLMCTASHNPKAYTGAKLVKEGAIALSGDSGIGELRDLVLGDQLGDEKTPPARGSVEEVDIYAPFREAAMKVIDPGKVQQTKVVVDGGNGMAGPMVGPLLERLPVELVETYWTPDGNFPDHEPNPLLPENRQFIMDKVLETGADLGIAWDGDADRCFFIDDKGRFVDGDFLTAILAEHLLVKQPRSLILYDVRASRAVADVVRKAGGRAEPNRVGHAFFKTRMRDEGAIFGGEVSGHYYFHDF